jgi:hypothetical protein
MTNTGGGDPAGTARKTFLLSPAQAAAAVHERCPQFVHLLPRQYRNGGA